MTGMPWALALAATAEPDSLEIEAITSTLTPLEIMPSASVENFCSSPWAFWISACRPAFCMAAVSSGLSKPSQRAELSVSGRITPTLAAPAAAAGADEAGAEGAAAFCPQAARVSARPRPAAAAAVLLMRIVVLPQRWGDQGKMLWPTTYVPDPRGSKHTESFKSSRKGLISVSRPGFVAPGTVGSRPDARPTRPGSPAPGAVSPPPRSASLERQSGGHVRSGRRPGR